jgi:hypothetical protein
VSVEQNPTLVKECKKESPVSHGETVDAREGGNLRRSGSGNRDVVPPPREESMLTFTSQPVQSLPTLLAQSFRLDAPLHKVLQKLPDPSPTLARVEHEPRTSLALPSPVFPERPALMHET